MGIELKFVLFQALVVVPFAAGMVAKRAVNGESWAGRIVRLNLMILEPPVIFWSIWGQSLRADHVFLPISGLVMVLVGFAAGHALAPRLALDGRGGKTFKISASLANHGFTMGGFVCYLFFGEPGLALASVFIVYFMPYTFLFIFGYARGDGGAGGGRGLSALVFSERNMPLYAFVAALLLMLAGVQRPAVAIPMDPLVMVVIALYYFALGLNFSASDIAAHARAHGAMAGIKFILVPACAAALVMFLPVDRLSASVILVQSFMPAAIYSVVASLLFGLDSRMASSLFAVNSVVFLALVLPALFLARAAGFF